MALAKPYTVRGPLTPIDVERIDRMLDELYRQAAATISASTSTTGSSVTTGSNMKIILTRILHNG